MASNYPVIFGLYRHIVGQVYRALYGENRHYEENLLSVQVCYILSHKELPFRDNISFDIAKRTLRRISGSNWHVYYPLLPYKMATSCVHVSII